MQKRPVIGRASKVLPLMRQNRRVLYAIDEVAQLLDVDPDVVRRALELEPGSYFPGAFINGDGSWVIPATDMRRLFGGREEPLFGLSRLAELLDLSYDHVRKEAKAGRIRTEMVLGVIRVPASEYWRLRGKRAPRSFIFDGGDAA